jgi:hypothetical protein
MGILLQHEEQVRCSPEGTAAPTDSFFLLA